MPHLLEQHHPGTKQWKEFTSVYRRDMNHSPSYLQLLQKLNNHSDISIVIYSKFGDASLGWIETEIPTLDGLTPKDCTNDARLLNLN